MPDKNVTRDGFLGGRISLCQPKDGYRAGTDAVLLAAAVPAKAGEAVLELGCGAGAASLCLMARVSGLSVTGVEIQPLYADLARRNAKANDLELEVIEGRIEALPKTLKARTFDHIVANPPYFETNSLTSPASPAKRTAHAHGAQALGDWIDAGRKRLRPGGSFTLIHRVDALPQIMAELAGGFGDMDVIPITSRSVNPASRIIVCARKGRKTPMRLHPPLVMHDGLAHLSDGNDYSATARAILTDAKALL